jgi:formylglycine-generating enzyme required for sulfatase activity
MTSSLQKYIKHLLVLVLLTLFIGCTNDAPRTEVSTFTKENKNAPTGMKYIPTGTLQMGGDNDQADKNEYPKHGVEVSAFYMDETEVTNAQFAQFVKATEYVTIAERPIDWEEMLKSLPPNTPKPDDIVLAAGALVFTPTSQPVSLDNPANWWVWVTGASWKHPEGPNTGLDGKDNLPVVQIAWEDAKAYADWAKKRLPTEAEWEWAARGGKENMIYPWGNESVNEGAAKANFYQGLFPYKNDKKDGFEGVAPVKSFAPNDYGLYDMSGNVWEWCSDWFDFEYYGKETAKNANTIGPERACNPYAPYQQEKIVRGGSFLCNDDYCSGYRNARRMGSTPDTGLNHTGFRCVRDVE